MKINDEHGLALTGASQNALETFALAQKQLQCYIGDPVATVNRVIAEAPGFVMAHLLRAYLHLLGTEPADIAIAHANLATAERLGGNARERAHQAAVRHLVEGRWRRAGRVLEDIAIEFPRDILALQAGNLVDFYTATRGCFATVSPGHCRPGTRACRVITRYYVNGVIQTGEWLCPAVQNRQSTNSQ